MALNFDCGQIHDWKTVCLTPEGEWSNRTERMTFLTIFLGMPVITKDNHEEFYRRCRIWERAIIGQKQTTLDDVVAYIGLRTNATPKTKVQFKNSVWETLEREAK